MSVGQLLSPVITTYTTVQQLVL